MKKLILVLVAGLLMGNVSGQDLKMKLKDNKTHFVGTIGLLTGPAGPWIAYGDQVAVTVTFQWNPDGTVNGWLEPMTKTVYIGSSYNTEVEFAQAPCSGLSNPYCRITVSCMGNTNEKTVALQSTGTPGVLTWGTALGSL